MEKWEYKSLEWIHKIREENYKKTKDKSLKEVMEKSIKKAEKLCKILGLKIYKPFKSVKMQRESRSRG